MSPDRLTCVVPTHNRPHFLRRLFQFYEQFPLPCSFFVADSSHPDAAAENIAVIDRVRARLNVTYQHFDLDVLSKCHAAVERVSTPLVVFCADDDYLFPASLERCVAELDADPGLSVAQGYTAIMQCCASPPTCRMTTSYSLNESDPISRCQRLASCWYSTFYGVSRTSLLRHSFSLASSLFDFKDAFIFPEQYLSQLSVLQGRVKVIPMVHSLWGRHDANTSAGPLIEDFANATRLYQHFRSCLAEQYQATGLPEREAIRIIDRWFAGLTKSPEQVRSDRRNSWRRLNRFWRRTQRQVRNLILREGIVCPREVMASDLAGQMSPWNIATQLMKDYPKGIFKDEAQERQAA